MARRSAFCQSPRHHTPDARPVSFQEVWFDEPSGSLDLISGCMFSGKTQELIRRLDQARFAGSTIQAFKPALDDRYALEAVASHREVRFPAIAVPDVAALQDQLRDDTRVVGIDEAQFFGSDIVSLVAELADRGRHVIVAGLDLDFLARPFGPMPLLAAYADRAHKTAGILPVPGCGSRQASRTQRLLDGEPAPADSPLVVIGGAATYEARCRHHHRSVSIARPEPVSIVEESAELLGRRNRSLPIKHTEDRHRGRATDGDRHRREPGAERLEASCAGQRHVKSPAGAHCHR